MSTSWREDAIARRDARQAPTPDKVRVSPKRSKAKPFWIQQYSEPFLHWRGHWWTFGRYRTERDWENAWKACVKEAKTSRYDQEFRRGGG